MTRVIWVRGTVKGDGSESPTGATVVVFPADQDRWGPQSRRILTAQVDRERRYAIDGLPAGDYLIAAVEDVEPGEWFDPGFLQSIARGAVRVELDEGERETKDLKLTPLPH